MKNLKNSKNRIWRSLLLSIATFVLLMGILFVAMTHFKSINDEQGLALTENSIRKAVLQCYAIEGMYPSDISYLKEHYNLELDNEKYIISYECYASNIMPMIFVYER